MVPGIGLVKACMVWSPDFQNFIQLPYRSVLTSLETHLRQRGSGKTPSCLIYTLTTSVGTCAETLRWREDDRMTAFASISRQAFFSLCLQLGPKIYTEREGLHE